MADTLLLRAHPWFSYLRSTLAPGNDGSPLPDPGEGERVHAAVSLVLRAGPYPEILLIRRAEADGDPWSGHMALPGGRKDPSDPGLLHTAIRETLEETGLDLEGAGLPLGRLKPLIPSNPRLPPISIHPFVFAVPEETVARTASGEVAEVLWAPVAGLRSPSAAGTEDIHLGDVVRTFPCIRVAGRVVWGLTYRILLDFFRILEEADASAPAPPPIRR